ncbi:transposase [Geminicoccaceae bacterium 1502E]|nr:transposase [Geminicoccaceae bacterium 1502E]
MTKLSGGARAGGLLPGRAPFRSAGTPGFIAALRHERTTAPCVQGGAEGGAAFRAWVGQSPAPTPAPGDIVVMDSLASHKAPGVRAAIRPARVHLLCLPPCSPGPSPIGQVFARPGHLLGKAGQRTAQTVAACIGSLLDSFAPGECAKCLTNAGYASIQAHPALRQRERGRDGKPVRGRGSRFFNLWHGMLPDGGRGAAAGIGGGRVPRQQDCRKR